MTTLEFHIKGPFSFEKTFYSPSHFPSKLELYTSRGLYTTLRFDEVILGLRVFPLQPNLAVDVYSQRPLTESITEKLREELRFRFSLDMDYSPYYKQYAADPMLRDVIRRNKGKRIASIYSLYENLTISVFLQNATVQRTISMCENMLNAYGTLVEFDDVELAAFWNYRKFFPAEAELRQLKVGYRAKNLIRVAKHFQDSDVSEAALRQLSTQVLEKELLKIYGIGKQTVFYTMLGQFHRTGYLKHIPLWERKILSKYIFNEELCDEHELVSWFQKQYGEWCGFALSMIVEDVFFQHKQEPILWLKEIMRET